MRMHLIGTADFATGERYSVYQFDGRQSCVVRNERTGAMTRAGTPDKAWDSVRYMARIGHRTEASPGVESVGYYAERAFA